MGAMRRAGWRTALLAVGRMHPRVSIRTRAHLKELRPSAVGNRTAQPACFLRLSDEPTAVAAFDSDDAQYSTVSISSMPFGRCSNERPRSAPMVLILEDVHHADPGSLLLLEFLTRELRELARPRFPRSLSVRTNVSPTAAPRRWVNLRARRPANSSPTDGAHLRTPASPIAHVSGRPCPEEIAGLIHARTAGNPFFVTELAQLEASWSLAGSGERAIGGASTGE